MLLRIDPTLFFVASYGRSWVFEALLSWLGYGRLLCSFGLDSFEDVIELLIDWLILRVHSSVLFDEVFAYFKFFLNVCGD